MIDFPIRRLLVSDFRRLDGTRELPFDAPVVLIHGANGTGKTSVLSALELALTGSVRSMERQSANYRAHLPFFGQSYATVRVDVAEHLRTGTPVAPLRVSGSRTEGSPAFNDEAAKFYAERCYLDQSSLGRLLELYQVREGNDQTALERFVNELLGLEKLDALRDGLRDANDLRLLKKLALGVDEAHREAKEAATEFEEQSAEFDEVRMEVANARASTLNAISALHYGTTDGMSDLDLIGFVQSELNDDASRAEAQEVSALHQELVALGGRISALVERPTIQRIQETRTALTAATADKVAWDATGGAKVRAWEGAAQAAGVNLRSERRIAVEHAMNFALLELAKASEVLAQAESVSTQLVADRAEFDAVQARLADAHEHSSAIVESLTALRTVIGDSNQCPVCDRDFIETGHHSLRTHIDMKLSELTTHGEELVGLRSKRDQLVARVTRREIEYAQLATQLLPADQRQAIAQRHATLVELTAETSEIEAIKSSGEDLARRVRDLRESLNNLEAASLEERHVSNELARYANLLQVKVPLASDSFQIASTELLEHAAAQVSRLADKADRYRRASNEAARLTTALDRESTVAQRLAYISENRKQWDDHVSEAKRRQGVAKEVHKAATEARTTIVHRVFTESLNEVWKAVFTRLAPNEGFIPSFGIPSATRKTFDIKFETTHRNGETSGPPQMMLSAGNLNTAALSLFLALHLAADPIVPCLVLDDPVQAMDEVHVAQFAGLIRQLSKQNGRQVIVAVHERELFDYLALELSPACEGDELITIELGERATEEDQGVIRHRWELDHAIAN